MRTRMWVLLLMFSLAALLNPTSTQFGMITTPSGMAMRFITFVTKFSF